MPGGPGGPAEPGGPGGPAEPGGPGGPAVPGGPGGPAEPGGPGRPAEPGGPGGPTGPGAPGGPADPGGPGGPTLPGGPAGPAGPVAPAAPGRPCAPGVPIAPGVPAAPCGPIGPCGPPGPYEPVGPCPPGVPLSPPGHASLTWSASHRPPYQPHVTRSDLVAACEDPARVRDPCIAFSGAPLAACVNRSRTARRPSSNPPEPIDSEWDLIRKIRRRFVPERQALADSSRSPWILRSTSGFSEKYSPTWPAANASHRVVLSHLDIY